jgi:hypothetical protein
VWRFTLFKGSSEQIPLSNGNIVTSFTRTDNRPHLDPRDMASDFSPCLFNIRIEHLSDVS